MVRCGGMDKDRVNLPARAPIVVAHRGNAASAPENTIAAMLAATNCGIHHLEIDIQLTADRIPVLLHDESLLRTAGIDQLVTASIAADLRQLSVGQADRFGQDYAQEYLPTLSDAMAALPQEGLTVFVELKRQSLHAFGRRRVLDAVLPVLDAAKQDFVLISFDAKVLQYVRNRSRYPIGLVLSGYGEPAIRQIVGLSPEFVFCNHTRLPRPDTPLWLGNWEWVMYEITSADQARSFCARGAKYVEGMDACRLNSELNL